MATAQDRLLVFQAKEKLETALYCLRHAGYALQDTEPEIVPFQRTAIARMAASALQLEDVLKHCEDFLRETKEST